MYAHTNSSTQRTKNSFTLPRNSERRAFIEQFFFRHTPPPPSNCRPDRKRFRIADYVVPSTSKYTVRTSSLSSTQNGRAAEGFLISYIIVEAVERCTSLPPPPLHAHARASIFVKPFTSSNNFVALNSFDSHEVFFYFIVEMDK